MRDKRRLLHLSLVTAETHLPAFVSPQVLAGQRHKGGSADVQNRLRRFKGNLKNMLPCLSHKKVFLLDQTIPVLNSLVIWPFQILLKCLFLITYFSEITQNHMSTDKLKLIHKHSFFACFLFTNIHDGMSFFKKVSSTYMRNFFLCTSLIKQDRTAFKK